VAVAVAVAMTVTVDMTEAVAVAVAEAITKAEVMARWNSAEADLRQRPSSAAGPTAVSVVEVSVDVGRTSTLRPRRRPLFLPTCAMSRSSIGGGCDRTSGGGGGGAAPCATSGDRSATT